MIWGTDKFTSPPCTPSLRDSRYRRYIQGTGTGYGQSQFPPCTSSLWDSRYRRYIQGTAKRMSVSRYPALLSYIYTGRTFRQVSSLPYILWSLSYNLRQPSCVRTGHSQSRVVALMETASKCPTCKYSLWGNHCRHCIASLPQADRVLARWVSYTGIYCNQATSPGSILSPLSYKFRQRLSCRMGHTRHRFRLSAVRNHWAAFAHSP
jgi:hypothetical protein